MRARICIGNQTAFSAASLMEPFVYALANKFDAFEWFPDKKPSGEGWEEADLDATTRAEIRQAARTAGMRLSVHGRWQANPLEPGALALLEKDLELAKQLGASLLNIHLYAEEGIPAYAKAIQPLARQAAQAGITLSIENSPENTPQEFNQLFKILCQQSPGAAHLGMCFDAGHANLCAATHNDYLGFLTQLDPSVPIVHLHLHENWGDYDSHLPLFTGPAGSNGAGVRGLIRRLKARRYAGSMILETWPDPPTLLNEARDKLQELLAEK